jgi:predicted porin
VAAATGAFAQSTVTLFGGADINYRSVKSGDNKFSGLAQDGIYSSRFGVMGTEDLGGGLKAGFHFEGGMNPDTGTPAGFNFTRKSTVGVMGGFGEVRLGRDYTPLFTVAGIADPFGTNGVGSSYNLANALTMGYTSPANATPAQATADTADMTWFSGVTRALAGTFVTAQTASASGAGSQLPTGLVVADPNAVRANNSIAYYSPVFSGFSANAMYSFGNENTRIADKAGTMTSVRLTYAQGPLTVAVANQATKGGAAAANALIAASPSFPVVPASTITEATDNIKYTTNFMAASYNLGFATVSAGYKTDKLGISVVGADASAKSKTTILGVAVPVGAAVLKASYITRKAEDEKVGTQFAVGGIYNLSKRTSVYANYAALTNKEGYGQTVGSAITSDFTGRKSTGFEAGVKHNF